MLNFHSGDGKSGPHPAPLMEFQARPTTGSPLGPPSLRLRCSAGNVPLCLTMSPCLHFCSNILTNVTLCIPAPVSRKAAKPQRSEIQLDARWSCSPAGAAIPDSPPPIPRRTLCGLAALRETSLLPQSRQLSIFRTDQRFAGGSVFQRGDGGLAVVGQDAEGRRAPRAGGSDGGGNFNIVHRTAVIGPRTGAMGRNRPPA